MIVMFIVSGVSLLYLRKKVRIMYRSLFKTFRSSLLSLEYKHLLVRGFLGTYITIALLLCIINTITQRYDRAIPEAIFVLIMLMGARHYLKTGNVLWGAHMSFWPPALLILFQLHTHQFNDFTIIYALLLPLATFFLYSLRRALVYTGIVYTILALLIIYWRLQLESHLYLHSTTALVNTLFGALFVIAFGLFYHLSFYRSYNALKHAHSQQEILLQEIHHRVKNNLNVIASIVGLQALNDDGRARSQLLHTKGRIESIAIVHEMLYKKHDDYTKIDFEPYVNKLGELVQRLHGTQQVAHHFCGNNIALRLEYMLDLGLIINELLINAYKHAFKNTPNPEILLNLHVLSDGVLRFHYHDNGCGIDNIEDAKTTQSLGLTLVELSVKRLQGTMVVQNQNGLDILITLKRNADHDFYTLKEQ